MPEILEGLPFALKQEINQPFDPICRDAEAHQIEKLVADLKLNPSIQYKPTNLEECSTHKKATGFSILAHTFVDEPDSGMDQNLPDSADPNDERPWMGGKTGATSQGFRHMYFGGVKPFHPLRTFQVPTRPVGQAPDRVELMALKARELMRAGNKAMGYRVLAWTIHYIQDLAQPFHTTQIPSLEMVPWHVLFAWPPSEGFQNLVRETTRTITNYHWAFEGYVHDRLLAPEGPFKDCLIHPETNHTLEIINSIAPSPRETAHLVADASIRLATRVGQGSIHFFGLKLKSREIYLPDNLGTPDYKDLAVRPDLTGERGKLNDATCAALANAASGTSALIEWTTRHPN